MTALFAISGKSVSMTYDQLAEVIKKIDVWKFNIVPMQARSKISIGELSGERISHFLPRDNPEAMAIFASYNPLVINQALPHLPKEYMHELSGDQLRKLDTSRCTQDQVDALFTDPNPVADYEKTGNTSQWMGETIYEYEHKSCRNMYCNLSEDEVHRRTEKGWKKLRKLTVLSEDQIKGFGDKLRPEHKKIWKQLITQR